MKIKTLKDLYSYIIDGGVFEDLENNCERCNNEVYEDEDFETFLRSINTEEIKRTDTKIFLTDEETTVSINYIDIKNRFDSGCGNETLFFFDTIELV